MYLIITYIPMIHLSDYIYLFFNVEQIMSLFKAREWWSTTVGDNENYDTGCLCVANIDNAQDKLGKCKP